LNIQLNNAQTSGVLRCSGSTSTTLLGSASALSLKDSTVSIELDGTGITGLTRDNGTDCVTFSGTFNGNGGKIKLATGEAYYAGNKTEGNGKIYRHAYNGLFAMTSGATIQNLSIASDSSITVNALDEMYIGNVVARASGGLILSSVKVCNDGKTTPVDYATIDDTGSSINIFSYNAVYNSLFDNDGNGNYGQLGLDGKEMDESGASFVQIKSAARYNTYEYNQKTAGNYVKITVKLSKKGEADETDPYTTALKISDYLADFEILDKNGHAFEETLDDPSTEDVDEGITVTKNSSDNIYTYIVPKDMLDTLSDDEFYIPINFKAYSGNNLTFEGKNSGETPKDMQYSNYKVHVTVGLLATRTSESVLPNSDGQDHIIYTNAKIHSEVIE
jgi:hypothetical protein